MAHPQETRTKLRQLYISGNQTLETAALMCQIATGTARRWKEAAKETGDDWDKLRAAYTLAGGGIEALGRAMMAGFLSQYSSTMEMLQGDTELNAAEKVKLLAALADAFTKTVAANSRILPETSKLAVALQVVEALLEHISNSYPNQLQDFALILQTFEAVIERKFGG